MKKIILVLMVLAAGTTAFASGAQEENDEGVVRLRRGEVARTEILSDLEKIEIKGIIKFESPVPELAAAGQDYTLMAPGAREYIGIINEGDSITVTGYIVDEDTIPGPNGYRDSGRRDSRPMHADLEVLEDNITLFVESVTIDGTTYELPWVDGEFAGREGSRGRKGNMQDNRSDRRRNNG